MEKSDLMAYRDLAREVRQLRTAVDALEESMYSPRGQRYTATPHASSGKGVTMTDVVGRHIELEALYKEKLATKNAQLLGIEKAIDTLETPAWRLVLRHRYIDGYSWGRVCAEMAALGYSERSTYRMHGEALLKLKEV